MAKMHELYRAMENIEAELQWVDENSTEGQKQKLNSLLARVSMCGLTPEEAQRFWRRRSSKAAYNSPLRQARRKPTPQGDGWDAEHQLGTVKAARKSQKGSK